MRISYGPVHGELQIRYKNNRETTVAIAFTWDDANVKRCFRTSQITEFSQLF